MCNTFNSVFNVEDEFSPRVASLTGILNGFTLEANVGNTYYMLYGISPTEGARIVVHHNELPPIPDEEGVDLHPGQKTSIPLTINKFSRLKDPYKPNCTNNWNQTMLDIDTNVTYSLGGCQRMCLFNAMIDECGCFHPNLYQAKLLSDEAKKTLPRVCFIAATWSSKYKHFNSILYRLYMFILSDDDYVCIQKVYDEYSQKLESVCGCHVACQETTYDTTTSVSKWPSDDYVVSLH